MIEAYHQVNMRVQYKDTDQMGVVHHGNYITWFEVGRTEWMRHYGISYRKMEDSGLLLPVLDVNVKYLKSARFDDCVGIFTKVINYSQVRIEFSYEARKIREEDLYSIREEKIKIEPYGELLAKGSTTHMWVNHDWKPVRLNKVALEVYTILQNLV